MARLNVQKNIQEQSEAPAMQQNTEFATLTDTIVSFYRNDNFMKTYRDNCSQDKARITELMKKLQLDAVNYKGLKCSLVQKNNSNINQEGLLEACKELGIEGLVKTVEVVDMDVLEDLIYNKKIEPSVVEPFIIKSVTEYPRVSGKLILEG